MKVHTACTLTIHAAHKARTSRHSIILITQAVPSQRVSGAALELENQDGYQSSSRLYTSTIKNETHDHTLKALYMHSILL